MLQEYHPIIKLDKNNIILQIYTLFIDISTVPTCSISDWQVSSVGQEDRQAVSLTTSSCYMKTKHKAKEKDKKAN